MGKVPKGLPPNPPSRRKGLTPKRGRKGRSSYNTLEKTEEKVLFSYEMKET